MHFTALDNLNAIIGVLTKNAATIAFSLAALLLLVTAIQLLFDHDTSPAARSQRWDKLIRVVVITIVVAGFGAVITFARQFGGAL